MNILVINHYAGSTEMGMEFRPYYMAHEWIKLGHKVNIIAGDYSHLRKVNPVINNDFETENIDGITYYWVKTGTYEGNGVKRAITMFRFVGKLWWNASKIVKKIHPDVIIASSTYPIDTFAAQRVAKKAKAKLIHEVHDMWPATLIELGGMAKTNPFVIAMQLGEDSAYKNSDFVVSLLPNTKKYMMEHGMAEQKFVWIPNGVVLEDWEKQVVLPKDCRKILEKCRRKAKFIVGYFGGHAMSNALDTLIDTARSLKDNRDILFVLVGDGTEKSRLQGRAKGLSNILFLPSISKKYIPALLQKFDCVYIGAKKSTLYRFGISMNKLYDAMMGGKPILYAVTAANNYVEQYHCGISVEPESVEALKKGILQMLHMPLEQREKMGSNGQAAAVQNFSYEVLAKRLLDAIK